MKKASKILTFILVFALLVGVLSGCAMFGRNSAKYRNAIAVNVGDENITVGKILDTFNNYYNTYSSYIGQGITVESLLQMSLQSLVTQSMKVDKYVNSNSPADDGIQLEGVRHSEYLTKEEIEFLIKYVKYLTFQTFDDSVVTQLTANRTLGEEKTEDTSRDFTEFDDLEGREYSEYLYRNRIFNKEAQEYFDKYYKDVEITANMDVNEYVYKSEAAAEAKIANLNERLDEKDDKITFAEYTSAQERVVKQYQRSVKNTYDIEFKQFMENQVADMVASAIVAKYEYNVNKTIDTTNLEDTIKQLNSNLAINSAAQSAGFALNNNFVSFIEGLTSTSYIYNVPEEFARTDEHKDGYIFVKNILIPFTDQQKTTLENYAKDLGNDDKKQAYIDLRNQYASEVVADDFNAPIEGEDKEYNKIYNLFTTDVDGKLIVNPDGALGGIFLADGSVAGDTAAEKDKAVVENMKRFNTDTAQHTAAYEYVVRVGEVPSGYKAKWVNEFVEAANVAADLGQNHYALAISTYGVHIVYYSSDVKAQSFDFAANRLKTDMPEYKLFSAYFSEQSTLLLQDNLKALQKSYMDEGKVSTSKHFKRFLKDNDFKFDLIDFLTDKD